MNVAEAVRTRLLRWFRRHESRADDLDRIDAEQADRDARVARLELQLKVQLRRWGDQ